MAANTSFKVQCPSCEAQVPIRDPNLVGRKIDCPKCKYRFVVEEPDGDGAADDRPARQPAGKAKPKPKKGGNNVMILGSIIGGVALIVLGVVAYMIFGSGGDSTPAKPKPTPVAASTGTPTPNPTPTPTPPANDAAAGATNPAANAAAPTPAAGAAAGLSPGIQTPVAEISNLLPNETQSVISINMDRLRNSTLGQQAFESRIGFRPSAFKDGFGLAVEEIYRFVRAEHLGSPTWAFNVMSTHRPVSLGEFQGPLGLQKGPKSPIQGREYFIIAPNPLLDHLSAILQSELEARDARAPEKKKQQESSGPLTLCMLNPTTIVVANQDIMEEFLQANAEPQKQSKMVGEGGGAAAPGPGVTPPGGGRRGRGPGAPGAPGGAPDGDQPEAGGPQFTDRNGYLTVDTHLKAMLDRLEGNGENLVLCTAQLLRADPKIVERLREASSLQVDVQGMRVLGVVLNNLGVEKCKGEIALEMFREDVAKTLEEQLKKVLGPVGRILGLYLGGLRIDVEGADAGAGPGGGPGGGPGLSPPTPGGPARGRGAPDAGGGNPDDPNAPAGEGSKSKLKFERKGRTLALEVDLNLNERAYDRIYALTEGVIMRMKGLVEMASGEPRFHELAEAAVKYRTEDLTVAPKDKEKKPKDSYPRGTFARDENIGRLSRTWPPNQRVGWMAGLLPYLGYQEVYDGIALRESWRSEVNMKQGTVLIPQFLNPRYPRPSWRAHPPSVGVTRDLGATHFVGIAGVGIDAADFTARDAQDPALAKKLGVFGYERRTTVKDISDGLANTAFMIQVPPTHQRPWIAGGGATVTGIPDTRSVQPFVSTQANGKRGTYLLMCDGSVRFVKDDISDDVFKALCTIKGGETVDVNAEAPKVDRPKGPSMKTADAGKPADAPGGQ